MLSRIAYPELTLFNMETKWIDISRLPKIPRETDWNVTFCLLQNPTFTFPENLSPAQQALLELSEGELLLIMHWVIKKKWISRHKIPFPRKAQALYEPKGDYWFWILELCLQLHPTEFGQKYRNAGEWFCWLIHEQRQVNGAGVVNDKIRKGGQKEAIRQNYQSISGKLRRGENPFNQESTPHHWLLAEAGLSLAEVSDRFDQQYWKKFKAALSKVSKLDGFDYVWIGEEKLCAQGGRGKHVVSIDLPQSPLLLGERNLPYAQTVTGQGF